MLLEALHYEDIKASIRKKWRSLKGFEEANGLPPGGVNDWGRGRRSSRVQRAIELHLASVISPTIAAGNADTRP